MPISHENPFRIHGTVREPFFTDREEELKRFTRVLREPGQKMLVYGERRMGKTSTLENAVDRVNEAGGHAFLADLSTVTTVADMTNRILLGATKAIGRRWTTFVTDLVGRMQAAVKLSPDPISGLLVPSVELGARAASAEAQQESLATVLDTLDRLASERKVTLGLVLDEFQEVNRLGGEQNEWHLRGTMQRHQHLSYVAAGSKPSLIKAMVGKGRAFYELFDLFTFAPIDPAHMANWIDERMREVGLMTEGAGTLCVAYAGARTRDIVRLARKCVDRASDGDVIGASDVAAAFREIVDEDDDAIHSWWDGLTPPQQNTLRAVAGTSAGLTTAATRTRFGLEVSGTVSNTLRTFVEEGRLLKASLGSGSGYAFDNPFVRGWVVDRALPDIGLREAITFIATETGEYATRRR
jgi:hypothetical protein